MLDSAPLISKCHFFLFSGEIDKFFEYLQALSKLFSIPWAIKKLGLFTLLTESLSIFLFLFSEAGVLLKVAKLRIFCLWGVNGFLLYSLKFLSKLSDWVAPTLFPPVRGVMKLLCAFDWDTDLGGATIIASNGSLLGFSLFISLFLTTTTLFWTLVFRFLISSLLNELLNRFE